MPAEKDIAARRQTQQKLELMERYWGAWCTILARARSRHFCKTRLWLIDTHAGRGLHDSAGDPDGVVPGTPLQATFAARAVQRAFPGTVVAVRASDNHKGRAGELARQLGPFTGPPPDRVDVRIEPTDWVQQVPTILRELAAEDHPSQVLAYRPHAHRSLWFVDPYGIDGLDQRVLTSLPQGAEVVVNFDAMTAVLYASAHRSRFTHCVAHALRASGSQIRYMIHLTDNDVALEQFADTVRRALLAGTIVAGRLLTKSQKDTLAHRLFDQFRGQALTSRVMRGVGVGLDLGQLRTVCIAADQLGYGSWDDGAKAMTWFAERLGNPRLGL
jgi:three-Cys-motif partner protein